MMLRTSFAGRPYFVAAASAISCAEDFWEGAEGERLVATEAGVEQFNEIHELGLFTEGDHLDALKDSGLKTSYDHSGFMDRGLYIGVKPVA